jgi:hypothetical protein
MLHIQRLLWVLSYVAIFGLSIRLLHRRSDKWDAWVPLARDVLVPVTLLLAIQVGIAMGFMGSRLIQVPGCFPEAQKIFLVIFGAVPLAIGLVWIAFSVARQYWRRRGRSRPPQ